MRIYVVIGCFSGVLQDCHVYDNEREAEAKWREIVKCYGLDPDKPLPGYDYPGHNDYHDVWIERPLLVKGG